MDPSPQPRIARFGLFEADFESRQLTKSGFRIRLQGKPFQVLALLMERQGAIVTREELKAKLWAGDTFVEFDVGLNTAVKKLRAALNDSADNPRFIETIPRIGYKFLAPVSLSPGMVAAVSQEGEVPSGEDIPGAAVSGAVVSGTALSGVTIAESAASGATPQGRKKAGNRGPTRHLKLIVAWAAPALVLLAVVLAIMMRSKSPVAVGRAGPIQAIAVLPLLNVSADPAQEYFADGMTDEIITDLAKLGGPKVISRTSVMQYKGTRKTIPEISRELQVGAILEGSVERSGDRMRIRVQLIEASTDQHLWAEAYERQVSDVLKLESDLAQDMARQIAMQLTQQQQQNLSRNRVLNPQAFQDYLQGRHYWAMRTNESLKKAVEYFNRAIQEDPNQARSYAGLAECYIVLPMITAFPQTEAYPKARDAAAKALALDDSLAEAHLSIAEVKFWQDWDFRGAEKEFKKTLDLNPNNATGHQWYGEFLSLMARPKEAIHEMQTALALDPLSPVVHLQFGNTLQQGRKYDLALEQYNQALKIDPTFSPPFDVMHWAYRREGKFKESIPPLRTAVRLWGRQDDLGTLVDQLPAAYSTGGRTAYLRQSIKIHKLYARHWMDLALDYADLGDRESALAALNKAYENREGQMVDLLIDPELDPLRSDPRFLELEKRVGFPL